MPTDVQKKPNGRPPIFSHEIADEICRRISEGESLIKMCREDHPRLPTASTVWMWNIKNVEGFSERYALARKCQMEHFAEQLRAIPLDKTIDPARARLMCENLKWLMARICHQHWGDKMTKEVQGPDGGAIPMSVNVSGLSDAQLAVLNSALDNLANPAGSIAGIGASGNPPKAG